MSLSVFNNPHTPLIKKLMQERPYFVTLRQRLHQNPELSRREYQTADFIESLLHRWGIETTRYDNTGIVATVTKGSSDRNIAFRADIDALPITEANQTLPYRSKNEGVMHACGHDGHTTMLLMALKYLKEEADFSGTVTAIFQPDEEDTAGAERMVKEGLFQDHDIDYIYAMHNFPGAKAGTILLNHGPQMAGTCTIEIDILGPGGHAAHPYQTADTVLASAHLITALQSIVSRNLSAIESAVVTIGSIHGGSANNVIPNCVSLLGTLRYFDIAVRDRVKKRIEKLSHQIAASFNTTAKVTLTDGYIPTINDEDATELALASIKNLIAPQYLKGDKIPSMGAEDFGFMLKERPGAYLYIGNDFDDEIIPLHTDRYNFNDDNLLVGAAIWIQLALDYL